MIGKEINLGSPKQLQVVLFDELDMPKTKRTKTGYTTDADALQTLFEQTGHEFLSHLLVHRDATRLKITVEGLLKSVADDGRIHTTYSQTIAATGRLSSTEPNLQNVPIRTAAGRRIRETFVVGPGYAELMTADYSQIEMRIMAHLSEDAALIAELLSLAGIDRRFPRLDVAPQQRKQKTLDALWRLVETPSRRRPIIAIFEDVHWIDPTSLQLLDRAIERVPQQIAALTSDAIQKAAVVYLDKSRYVQVTLMPEGR